MKSATYGSNPHNGDVFRTRHAFFQKADGETVCVFASITRGPATSIWASVIIDAIAQKEQIDWRTVTFADLRSNSGWEPMPSGYYEYTELEFDDATIAAARAETCSSVSFWNHIECPLNVFQAFARQIGTFPRMEEVISPSRSCYKQYGPEKMREELNWAKGHKAWMSGIHEVSKLKNLNVLRTADQARALGYVFDPRGPRYDSVPEPAKVGEEGVCVDLRESHLYGQHVTRFSYEPLCRPQPFAWWGLPRN